MMFGTIKSTLGSNLGNLDMNDSAKFYVGVKTVLSREVKRNMNRKRNALNLPPLFMICSKTKKAKGSINQRKTVFSQDVHDVFSLSGTFIESGAIFAHSAQVLRPNRSHTDRFKDRCKIAAGLRVESRSGFSKKLSQNGIKQARMSAITVLHNPMSVTRKQRPPHYTTNYGPVIDESTIEESKVAMSVFRHVRHYWVIQKDKNMIIYQKLITSSEAETLLKTRKKLSEGLVCVETNPGPMFMGKPEFSLLDRSLEFKPERVESLSYLGLMALAWIGTSTSDEHEKNAMVVSKCFINDPPNTLRSPLWVCHEPSLTRIVKRAYPEWIKQSVVRIVEHFGVDSLGNDVYYSNTDNSNSEPVICLVLKYDHFVIHTRTDEDFSPNFSDLFNFITRLQNALSKVTGIPRDIDDIDSKSVGGSTVALNTRNQSNQRTILSSIINQSLNPNDNRLLFEQTLMSCSDFFLMNIGGRFLPKESPISVISLHADCLYYGIKIGIMMNQQTVASIVPKTDRLNYHTYVKQVADHVFEDLAPLLLNKSFVSVAMDNYRDLKNRFLISDSLQRRDSEHLREYIMTYFEFYAKATQIYKPISYFEPEMMKKFFKGKLLFEDDTSQMDSLFISFVRYSEDEIKNYIQKGSITPKKTELVAAIMSSSTSFGDLSGVDVNADPDDEFVESLYDDKVVEEPNFTIEEILQQNGVNTTLEFNEFAMEDSKKADEKMTKKIKVKAKQFMKYIDNKVTENPEVLMSVKLAIATSSLILNIASSGGLSIAISVSSIIILLVKYYVMIDDNEMRKVFIENLQSNQQRKQKLIEQLDKAEVKIDFFIMLWDFASGDTVSGISKLTLMSFGIYKRFKAKFLLRHLLEKLRLHKAVGMDTPETNLESEKYAEVVNDLSLIDHDPHMAIMTLDKHESTELIEGRGLDVLVGSEPNEPDLLLEDQRLQSIGFGLEIDSDATESDNDSESNADSASENDNLIEINNLQDLITEEFIENLESYKKIKKLDFDLHFCEEQLKAFGIKGLYNTVRFKFRREDKRTNKDIDVLDNLFFSCLDTISFALTQERGFAARENRDEFHKIVRGMGLYNPSVFSISKSLITNPINTDVGGIQMCIIDLVSSPDGSETYVSQQYRKKLHEEEQNQKVGKKILEDNVDIDIIKEVEPVDKHDSVIADQIKVNETAPQEEEMINSQTGDLELDQMFSVSINLCNSYDDEGFTDIDRQIRSYFSDIDDADSNSPFSEMNLDLGLGISIENLGFDEEESANCVFRMCVDLNLKPQNHVSDITLEDDNDFLVHFNLEKNHISSESFDGSTAMLLSDVKLYYDFINFMADEGADSSDDDMDPLEEVIVEFVDLISPYVGHQIKDNTLVQKIRDSTVESEKHLTNEFQREKLEEIKTRYAVEVVTINSRLDGLYDSAKLQWFLKEMTFEDAILIINRWAEKSTYKTEHKQLVLAFFQSKVRMVDNSDFEVQNYLIESIENPHQELVSVNPVLSLSRREMVAKTTNQALIEMHESVKSSQSNYKIFIDTNCFIKFSETLRHFFNFTLVLPVSQINEIGFKFKPIMKFLKQFIIKNEFIIVGERDTTRRGDHNILEDLLEADNQQSLYYLTLDKEFDTQLNNYFKRYNTSDLLGHKLDESLVSAYNETPSDSFTANFGPHYLDDSGGIHVGNTGFLSVILELSPFDPNLDLVKIPNEYHSVSSKSLFFLSLEQVPMEFSPSSDQQIHEYDESLIESLEDFDHGFIDMSGLKLQEGHLDRLLDASIDKHYENLIESIKKRGLDTGAPRKVNRYERDSNKWPDSGYPEVSEDVIELERLIESLHSLEPAITINDKQTDSKFKYSEHPGRKKQNYVLNMPESFLKFNYKKIKVDRQPGDSYDNDLKFFKNHKPIVNYQFKAERDSSDEIIGDSLLCQNLAAECVNESMSDFYHWPHFEELSYLFVHILELTNTTKSIKKHNSVVIGNAGFNNKGYIIPRQKSPSTLNSLVKFRLYFVVDIDVDVKTNFKFYPDMSVRVDDRHVMFISKAMLVSNSEMIYRSRLYPSLYPFRRISQKENFEIFFFALWFGSTFTKGILSMFKYLTVVFHSDYSKINELLKKYISGVPKREVDCMLFERVKEVVNNVINKRESSTVLYEAKSLHDMLEGGNIYSAPRADTISTVHDYQIFYDDILNNIRSKSEFCFENEFSNTFTKLKHISIPAMTSSVIELSKKTNINLTNENYQEVVDTEFRQYFFTTTNGVHPKTLKKEKNSIIATEMLNDYLLETNSKVLDHFKFIDWCHEKIRLHRPIMMISKKVQKDVADREISIQSFFLKACHFHLQMAFKTLCSQWSHELVTKSEYEKIRMIARMNFDEDTYFINDDMAKWSPQDLKRKFDVTVDLLYHYKIITAQIHHLLTKSLRAVKDIIVLFDKRLKNKNLNYVDAKKILDPGIKTEDLMKIRNVFKNTDKFSFHILPFTHGWPQGLMHFASSFVHGLATMYNEKMIKTVIDPHAKVTSLFHSDDKNTSIKLPTAEKNRETEMKILKLNAMTSLSFSLSESKTKPSMTYRGSRIRNCGNKKISEMVSVYNIEGVIMNSYLRQCATIFTSLVHRDFISNHLEIISRCCQVFSLTNSLLIPELIYTNNMRYLKHYYKYPEEISENIISCGGLKSITIMEISILGIQGDNYHKFRLNPKRIQSQIHNPIIVLPLQINKRMRKEIEFRMKILEFLSSGKPRSDLQYTVSNEIRKALSPGSGLFLSSRDALFHNFYRQRNAKHYATFESIKPSSGDAVEHLTQLKLEKDYQPYMKLSDIVYGNSEEELLFDERTIGNDSFKKEADRVLFSEFKRLVPKNENEKNMIFGIIERSHINFSRIIVTEFEDILRLANEGNDLLKDPSWRIKFNKVRDDLINFMTNFGLMYKNDLRKSKGVYEYYKKISNSRSPLFWLWKSEREFKEFRLESSLEGPKNETLSFYLKRVMTSALIPKKFNLIKFRGGNLKLSRAANRFITNTINATNVMLTRSGANATNISRFLYNRLQILNRIEDVNERLFLKEHSRSFVHKLLFSYFWDRIVPMPKSGIHEVTEAGDMIIHNLISNSNVVAIIAESHQEILVSTNSDVKHIQNVFEKRGSVKVVREMTESENREFSGIHLSELYIDTMELSLDEFNDESDINICFGVTSKDGTKKEMRRKLLYDVTDDELDKEYFYGVETINNAGQFSHVKTTGHEVSVIRGKSISDKIEVWDELPPLSQFDDDMFEFKNIQLCETSRVFTCTSACPNCKPNNNNKLYFCVRTGRTLNCRLDHKKNKIFDIADFKIHRSEYRKVLVEKLRNEKRDYVKSLDYDGQLGYTKQLLTSIRKKYDQSDMRETHRLVDLCLGKVRSSSLNKVKTMLDLNSFMVFFGEESKRIVSIHKMMNIKIEFNPRLERQNFTPAFSATYITDDDNNVLVKCNEVRKMKLIEDETTRGIMKNHSEGFIQPGEFELLRKICRQLYQYYKREINPDTGHDKKLMNLLSWWMYFHAPESPVTKKQRKSKQKVDISNVIPHASYEYIDDHINGAKIPFIHNDEINDVIKRYPVSFPINQIWSQISEKLIDNTFTELFGEFKSDINPYFLILDPEIKLLAYITNVSTSNLDHEEASDLYPGVDIIEMIGPAKDDEIVIQSDLIKEEDMSLAIEYTEWLKDEDGRYDVSEEELELARKRLTDQSTNPDTFIPSDDQDVSHEIMLSTLRKFLDQDQKAKEVPENWIIINRRDQIDHLINSFSRINNNVIPGISDHLNTRRKDERLNVLKNHTFNDELYDALTSVLNHQRLHWNHNVHHILSMMHATASSESTAFFIEISYIKEIRLRLESNFATYPISRKILKPGNMSFMRYKRDRIRNLLVDVYPLSVNVFNNQHVTMLSLLFEVCRKKVNDSILVSHSNPRTIRLQSLIRSIVLLLNVGTSKKKYIPHRLIQNIIDGNYDSNEFDELALSVPLRELVERHKLGWLFNPDDHLSKYLKLSF